MMTQRGHTAEHVTDIGAGETQEWFEPLLDQVVERIEAGDRLIELR